MPKQVEIAPDVRAVLERGTWPDPAIFRLPDGQLDRKLYEGVNKVLIALGGKWDRKVQGHRFSADARQALETALTDGVAVDQKRTMEQFFTPPAVARQLTDLMGLPRADVRHVLEPSAGAGAIVQALNEIATPLITAIEIDRALHGAHLASLTSGGHRLICGDFLSWEPPAGLPPIDAVAMNPPFGNRADIAHVTRALHFLRPGGVLGAIMSPHWTFATSAIAEAFRGLVNDHSHAWTPLPEGSFRASGTGVNSGILIIQKGAI